jgi:hypothetical protein
VEGIVRERIFTTISVLALLTLNPLAVCDVGIDHGALAD